MTAEKLTLQLLYILITANDKLKQVHRIISNEGCEGLVRNPKTMQALKDYTESVDKVTDEAKKLLEIGETK